MPYLKEELSEFNKPLEGWTGKIISDEATVEGVELMDRSRRLMKQIYECRKSENSPLTGLEATDMPEDRMDYCIGTG